MSVNDCERVFRTIDSFLFKAISIFNRACPYRGLLSRALFNPLLWSLKGNFLPTDTPNILKISKIRLIDRIY